MVLLHDFSVKYWLDGEGNLTNFNTGRKIRSYVNHDGYKVYSLRRANGTEVLAKVHRLLAENFIDNPHEKPYVIHIDGDKLNNSLLNLRWGDIQEVSNPYINMIKALEKRVKTLEEKL